MHPGSEGEEDGMIHRCDIPPWRNRFYDVYKCPVCKQWWRIQYTTRWEMTSRLILFLTGYERQCRSFLRHNKKR